MRPYGHLLLQSRSLGGTIYMLEWMIQDFSYVIQAGHVVSLHNYSIMMQVIFSI